jgi:hypothetical protein
VNALGDASVTQIGEALRRAEREAAAKVPAGRSRRSCADFDRNVIMRHVLLTWRVGGGRSAPRGDRP